MKPTQEDLHDAVWEAARVAAYKVLYGKPRQPFVNTPKQSEFYQLCQEAAGEEAAKLKFRVGNAIGKAALAGFGGK